MKYKLITAAALVLFSSSSFSQNVQPNQDSSVNFSLKNWKSATTDRYSSYDTTVLSCSDRYTRPSINNNSQFPLGTISMIRQIYHKTLVNGETVIDSYGDWNESDRNCYQQFEITENPACPSNQQGERQLNRSYQVIENDLSVVNDTGLIETINTCDYYITREEIERDSRACSDGMSGSGIVRERTKRYLSDGSIQYSPFVTITTDCYRLKNSAESPIIASMVGVYYGLNRAFDSQTNFYNDIESLNINTTAYNFLKSYQNSNAAIALTIDTKTNQFTCNALAITTSDYTHTYKYFYIKDNKSISYSNDVNALSCVTDVNNNSATLYNRYTDTIANYRITDINSCNYTVETRFNNSSRSSSQVINMC